MTYLVLKRADTAKLQNRTQEIAIHPDNKKIEFSQKGRVDDDRRLLTSDVITYVNKNQFRVVQLPYKARFVNTDDVKRVIGVKPV